MKTQQLQEIMWSSPLCEAFALNPLLMPILQELTAHNNATIFERPFVRTNQMLRYIWSHRKRQEFELHGIRCDLSCPVSIFLLLIPRARRQSKTPDQAKKQHCILVRIAVRVSVM